MINTVNSDTICALATPAGTGALAVIRISGENTFQIVSGLFISMKGKRKDLKTVRPYTIHYGQITDGDRTIDEVLLSVFKNPHSFTGEDTIEISCHGSTFIQQEILQLLIRSGARPAEPGEFTMRAFLNGKIDLSQAEAVADLISARHASAHKAAIQQLRGGYSNTIQKLRTRLVDFASLLELELDFAEEDVEFANRDKLNENVNELLIEIRRLQSGYASGNIMKTGIPVLIAGLPNVGKSTLLNALLNEERAIVSDIAGTTRDVIEDQLVIDGLRFRFMDTAGIRSTEDEIEKIGVERTMLQAGTASIIVYVCDPAQSNKEEVTEEIARLRHISGNRECHILTIINKCDCHHPEYLKEEYADLPDVMFVSARQQLQIDNLKDKLVSVSLKNFFNAEQTLITNARHAESLQQAAKTLDKVLHGIKNHLSTDLLAFEVRDALRHLSEITGDVYTEDLLGNIFSKFCIGK